MKNISIPVKYVGSFVIILFLFAATITAAWNTMADVATAINLFYSGPFQVVDMGRTAQRDFLDLRRHYLLGTTMEPAVWSKGYLAHHAKLQDDLAHVVTLSANSDIRTRAQQAAIYLRTWDALIAKGTGSRNSPTLEATANQVQAEIGVVVDRARADAADAVAQVQTSISRATQIITVVGAATGLLAFVIAAMLAIDILRPLNRALNLARHIAAGDLNEQIAVDRRDEFGQLLQALETMRDHLRRTQAAMEQEATTDKLTGLANRRKLEQIFATLRQHTRRYGDPISVIILDVDKFKSVNDTHGHEVGDQVLVHVAQTLAATARELDTVGRWGGEEFLVICPNTDVEGAAVLAEKLRAALEQHIFPVVHHKTASFGVTQANTTEELAITVKRADGALYQAKESGRNRVEIAA